jgi:predicted PurR-regulated permease PerM
LAQSGISYRMLYVGVGMFLVLLAALLVGIYFVSQIQQIVLAFLLTLLLSVVLGAPVNLLARLGLPRAVATLATLGLLAGALWLFWRFAVPTVSEQFAGFLGDLPRILEETIDRANRALAAVGLGDQVQLDAQGLQDAARDALTQDTLLALLGAGMTAANLISLGLLVLFATVYLVSQPGPWVNGFALLFPARKRERVREVLGKVHKTVQAWVLGQMASMIFIGVSTTLALYLIGVPFALLLGIFGGLISFVPFLGAIASAVPPILVALVTDPVMVIWVVVAYTVIQQIEGNAIQPIVMSRILALHPAQVLFAIFIAGTLFGLVGVILAVPALAAIQVLVNELWVRRMNRLGEDPAASRQEDRRESGSLTDGVRNALKSRRS